MVFVWKRNDAYFEILRMSKIVN